MARKPIASIVDDDACCTPLLAEPIDDVTAASMAHGFAALADPVRLRLLSLLAAAETGEVCVCDLTEPVGKSQPTVSHHLKVLAEAGLVESEKRGRWAWYRLRPERLRQLQEVLAAP